jgi:outer membrane cobalamin receptor
LRHPIVIWFCLFTSVLLAQKDTVVVLRPDLKTFFSDSVNGNTGYNSIKFSGLRDQDEREAIGSVYVLDRRMIVASGARDIHELLQFVPGISFGRDVNDVVGLAMRGLWVHEGKFTIMINGMPINELSFGSYCFINRLTIENVSHVEIILGPGSVNYGGTASLGVINIVTLKAGQRDGTSVGITNAGTSNGISRQNICLTGNHYLGNSTFFSYSYSGLKGFRSVNIDNHSTNWKDSTRVMNEEFFMSIERKNLKAQVYQNTYDFSVFGEQFDVQMKTSNADIAYNQKIGNRNLFNAQLGYIHQLPWNIQNTIDYNLINSNTITERIHLQLQFNSKVGKYFESNLGLQGYDIKSNRLSVFADRTSVNALKVADGSKGLGLFLETYGRFNFGTFSMAGRMEISNLVGPLFAPRVGYILTRPKFHVKASYAESFKIPTIENFYLGPEGQDLKSERNRTSEFEFGVRLAKHLNIRMNGFMNRVINPIVYVFDDITYDNYLNRPKISNQGFEAMCSYLDERWTVRLGLSYQELQKSKTDLPEVYTLRDKSVQGIPNWMANAIINFQVNREWSFGVNLLTRGSMYNYEYMTDSSEEMSPIKYKQIVRLNSLINYIPAKWSDFEFRFAVLNILNQTEYFLSPYSVGLNSIPSAPRELTLSVYYRITH